MGSGGGADRLTASPGDLHEVTAPEGPSGATSLSPPTDRLIAAESSATEPLAPTQAAEVAAALTAGRLVALPTETVYGIAARADDPAALDRLVRLKGRDPSKPLSWHVGDVAALERFERLSPLARRLATKYWPGPLTLVLAGSPGAARVLTNDGWTGVRHPAHAGTSSLLASLDFPVAMSSANLAGEPALCDAAAVLSAFGDELAVVVDGGPARLGEPSAVLRVGSGRFELIRAGLFDLDSLRRTAGLRIAFCCTGNTCRSPMAETVARARLAERLETTPEHFADFGFEVASMGVFAPPGAPASGLAVDVMESRGLDLSEHASRPAIDKELLEYDLVLGLTRSHVAALRELLPPDATNVELLDLDGRDVPDPIGGSRADYEHAADSITQAIDARLDDWA